jgi:hypothetical protein
MIDPLAGLCLWIIAAAAVSALPSKDYHWTWAYVLIAVGLPLLVWIVLVDGPWAGLLALAAGAAVLRWPLIHLFRWLRGLVR